MGKLTSYIADDTCILRMAAVVDKEAAVSTIRQGRLGPVTIHVVQNDRALTVAERGRHCRIPCARVTQHSADDLRIASIPQVIADRSPGTVVEQLDTTLVPCCATDQTNLSDKRMGKIRS